MEWNVVCVRVGTGEGFALNMGMKSLTSAWGEYYSG